MVRRLSARRTWAAVVVALGVALPLPAVTPQPALALDSSVLILQNGWANPASAVPLRTLRVSLADGIVTFRGAIAGGTSGFVGTLPPRFRPANTVYVPVALCSGERGTLTVNRLGAVTVSSQTFPAAQCGASFEGASFVKDPAGFSSLSLRSGWGPTPFATAGPGARLRDDVVQFKGAVAGGTAELVAVLPPAMRPAKRVLIPVDLCGGSSGNLAVGTDGAVTVNTGVFSAAQCSTSLEGASFVRGGALTALTLSSTWATAERSATPALRVTDGIVRLAGAISAGTDPEVFTLPRALRPTAEIWVPVNHCFQEPGHLVIAPSGLVSVVASGAFADASCLTTLDGVSWPVVGFQPVALANGWSGAPFGTAPVEAGLYKGVVTLTGAVGDGTGAITTLPAAMRPSNVVAVAADFCDGAVGAVVVEADGDVFADAAFADAQCFTSLEGVSFSVSGTDFRAASLRNGWQTLLGFPPPSAKAVDGVVFLRGAATAGRTAQIGVLPAGLRPPATVFERVAICDQKTGRLEIRPDGAVLVSAGRFARAQCATSLEGVSFPLGRGLTRLTLRNGWSATTQGTRLPAAANTAGVVHLSGAVASGTDSLITTLPGPLRPARTVYAPVSLCNTTQGRLVISPSGEVRVTPGVPLGPAQCITSLEGVHFVP